MDRMRIYNVVLSCKSLDCRLNGIVETCLRDKKEYILCAERKNSRS
jgi:hypothetical protein